MSAALSGIMASLSDLNIEGFNAVIAQARTLRAKAELTRMTQMVKVPVTYTANSESEYDDHGGTYTYWIADFKFPKPEGGFLEINSQSLGDGPDVAEEDVETLLKAFGLEDEDDLADVCQEFAELAVSYARFAAEGEDTVEVQVSPVADGANGANGAHGADGTDEFENECVLQAVNGRSVRAPAFPESCSYVRVLDAAGTQVGYWVEDEWKEDPAEVMGAILGAALGS